MILTKFSSDSVERATHKPPAETSDEDALQVIADFLRYDAEELSARSAMFGAAVRRHGKLTP
jgi:hypothetical protein